MLVIIFGLPGTGKSFFGEKLSKHLDWEYINSDRIRHALNLRGKYEASDKKKVYEAIFQKAKELLGRNKNIILDATFSDHKQLAEAKELAYNMGKEIKLIEMKADEQTIKERISKKRKYSEAGFDIYEKIKNEFDPIKEPHLVLDSSNNSVHKLLEKAKQYLFHE